MSEDIFVSVDRALVERGACEALSVLHQHLRGSAVSFLAGDGLLPPGKEGCDISIADLVAHVNAECEARDGLKSPRTVVALRILEALGLYHSLVGLARPNAQDLAAIHLCCVSFGVLSQVTEDLVSGDFERRIQAALLKPFKQKGAATANKKRSSWHDRALALLAEMLIANPTVKRKALHGWVTGRINDEYEERPATDAAVEALRLRKSEELARLIASESRYSSRN